MAKKITIQHYYTTGSTAPQASSLALGEIAMSTKKDNEGIYFKNNENKIVKVLTSAQTQTMILETAGSIEGFNEHIEHKANNREEYESNNPYGHVRLVIGDLSGYTNGQEDGVAASAYHTHGQYYSFLDSGKGLTTIIDAINHPNEIGFSIDDTTYNKITGATQSSTFNAHTGDTKAHITDTERNNWNTAANRINTFLDVQSGATDALDSLYEIQEYLTGSGNSVNTLLESLNELTDTVSGNTDDINALSGIVSTNTDNISANTKDIETLKSNQFNYVQDVDEGDNYIIVNPGAGGTDKKTVVITHNTAQAESSAVTASNITTELYFGDEFNILNKIAYDAKGHVVSGDTQTLKLPLLPVASDTNYGIAQLVGGNIAIPSDLQGKITPGKAAASYHWHDDYVKFTDLYSGNTSNNITISCGTY